MAKDDKENEIRHEGAKTHYREHKDDVSGGRDKSVQTEALGKEGLADLSVTSGTSGGAAGRIVEVDTNASPVRESVDEKDPKGGNRGGLTR